MKFKINIFLKKCVLDPEGKAIENALLNNGYNKLEDEWFHGDVLRYKGVQINPIGLNVKLYVNSNDLIV